MKNSKLTSPSRAIPTPAVGWLRGSWKIWFGSLVCTLIVNILCLPIWTNYDAIGFFRTLFNSEARMEIIYIGPLTGADAFSITSSKPSLSTFTNCCYADVKDIQIYTANLNIEKEWNPYKLTLDVCRKGWIQIRLKGPYRSDDYGKKNSIATDYRHLKIRDKEIFSGWRKVTHAGDFSYRIPVNANEAIDISFEVRRHHFDANDFNLNKTENFWYIITLSISALVIFYILLQRLSTSYKQGKAEDAIFVFFFFLLIVVPLSDMSDAQTAVREGRNLKQHPNVSSVLKEGANFGKEYDNWFCDHLGGREGLIKLHDVVQRETQRIIRGRRAWYMQDSGWLFEDLGWHLRSKDLGSIVKALAELEKFCEVNQIKLYVFVVPRRENIYQEQLHGYGFNRRQFAAENVLHGEIRRQAAKHHVTYIYPWTELRDACKRGYTYFKLVHHWTDWGAYIGYRALMEEIRRDFPNIPVVSLESYNQTQSSLIRDEWYRKFSTGNLGKFFNFETDRRCPSPTYNYYDHKYADKLVLSMGKFTKDFRYGGGAYKVMVIGTSQNENLMNFLPYSAAQTKYIRLNRGQLPGSEAWKIMKHYRKDILSYKPDVLIFSIFATDYNMLSIQNMFKK